MHKFNFKLPNRALDKVMDKALPFIEAGQQYIKQKHCLSPSNGETGSYESVDNALAYYKENDITSVSVRKKPTGPKLVLTITKDVEDCVIFGSSVMDVMGNTIIAIAFRKLHEEQFAGDAMLPHKKFIAEAYFCIETKAIVLFDLVKVFYVDGKSEVTLGSSSASFTKLGIPLFVVNTDSGDFSDSRLCKLLDYDGDLVISPTESDADLSVVPNMLVRSPETIKALLDNDVPVDGKLPSKNIHYVANFRIEHYRIMHKLLAFSEDDVKAKVTDYGRLLCEAIALDNMCDRTAVSSLNH